MASVLHPAIVVPALMQQSAPAPLFPAAAPPDPLGSGDDDDGGHPIATMARELSRLLEADGMTVTWHARDGAPVVLFSEGSADPASLDHGASTAMSHDPAPHSEWAMLDADAGGLMTTSIPTGDGVVTIRSLFHRITDGTRHRVREASARLMPLVQPFFGLWSSRLAGMARMRGLTEAVNNSDIGVVLVNGRGHIMFANAAAQAMVARGDGLRRNGTMLSGSRLSDTLRLQAAIEHVVGGGSEEGRAPSPVVAIDRRDRRPLLIAIVASEVAPASPEDCAAVIHVFDPEQDLRPLVEPACKFYGLSPVETRLACLLADGVSLADAAVAMHVREQTARSYLKQVFLKTETNRQAELVWLLLKSAVRTAPRCRTTFI